MQETTQATGSSLFSFDPIVILGDVLRRWYLIVAAVLLVGVSTRVGAELSYVPSYTATTTFVVSGRSGSSNVYDNLSRTSELATVFTEVLNSSILRETILQELDMDSFDGKITAAPMGKTNLLTMTVTSSNPRAAFLVSKAIIAHHHIVSARVLGDVALDVLQAPKVPMSPSNAKASLHTAQQIALLAGAAVFGVLAFISYNRDTIRSKKESNEKLDCHYLGEVAHEHKYKTLKSFLIHKKSSVLITHPETSFHFAESIQKIRRRISHRLEDGKKVFMVTSVMEDEGKSTIASNLALSFALVGHKTLLIDCDLRKPACWKILQHTEFQNGTLDVMEGKTSLSAALEQDSVTGLSMLLEKNTSASATELMTSEGMQKLLEQARKDFDVVILDMPPMSVAPDAEAAAALTDGIAMVVRQNTATATQINQAIVGLKNTDATVLGCVLNNMYSSGLTHAVGGGSYGYGYGYGRYGHYGKYGKYGHYGHYASGSEDKKQ